MKRILIISDSISRETGYATVANNIINNLDDSYIVAQFGLCHKPFKYDNINIHYYTQITNHIDCCNSGMVIEYYNPISKSISYINPGINLYETKVNDHCLNGKYNTTDHYGFNSIFFIIEHFKPDIVISINDIWGMYKINYLKNRHNFKHIAYLAVDSECFPHTINTSKDNINTMDFLSMTDKVVVFTDWAKNTINKTANLVCGKNFDNIEVIPHGVNLDVFNSKNINKKELVSKLYKLDSDKHFIIGSVNRNQPRKRLDAIFQILRELIDKYETPTSKKIMVHFHCAIRDQNGWDLQWLAKYYNVSDRIILDNNLRPGSGIPNTILKLIMNTYDIHLVPTNSEGWGLSILETMACGIPNIVSDYSAHGEWVKDSALKINIVAKIHEPITNHIKAIIDIHHAVDLIGDIYNDYNKYKDYRKKSFELANSLDWKKICVKWNNLIYNIDTKCLSTDRYLNKLSDKQINTECTVLTK